MNLEEIRTKRGLTQVQLASVLRINQSGLSKLERRSDMYVSMLRSLIQAMGGRIELRAIFPNEPPIEIGGLDGSNSLAELSDLLNKRCRIEPIPDNPEYTDFLLTSFDENVATFQKLSCQQSLDIPIRRIAEILPATSQSLPLIVLRGTVAWSGQKKMWQFRPSTPSQEDYS